MEVSAGASCAGASAVCGKGFYCDSGMHCVSRQTQGQSCAADGQCTEGLVCTASVCATKTSATACMTDDDCVDQACDIAVGMTTGMCVAQIILTPTDTTCQDLK
jgi:hypothetical protein